MLLCRDLVLAPTTVVGSRGQVRPNPLFAVATEHRRVLRYLLAGLRTPTREHEQEQLSSASDAGRSLVAVRWEKGGARGA